MVAHLFSGLVAGVLHDFDLSHPSARRVPKDLGLHKLGLNMGAVAPVQRVLVRCNSRWGVSAGGAHQRGISRTMIAVCDPPPRAVLKGSWDGARVCSGEFAAGRSVIGDDFCEITRQCLRRWAAGCIWSWYEPTVDGGRRLVLRTRCVKL